MEFPLPWPIAAGMIRPPDVLGTGSSRGCGMTIGAVFGRMAGEEAARHVLSEARRILTICTVCNYCNGFASVPTPLSPCDF